MWIDVNRLAPWARKQVMEKLAKDLHDKAPASQSETGLPKNKYRNIPTERSGTERDLRFDSKREAERYDELMLMLKAGAISDLRLQNDFTLIEAYTTPEGKRVRAERYKADFTYWRDGEFVVEDVKSKATKTKTYTVKKKQMLDKYGIEIKEVE